MECGHKFTMCRLCLSERECFIDIFQVNQWCVYVPADVITDLLQVQVSETDGFPQVVCSICLGKLTDFKQFKEQCQTSRDTYSHMIVSYKSHAEDPAHTVPSGIIKREVEEETNDVDVTTEVELSPVKLEPDDRLDNQVVHQEVRKSSISVTSLEYLEGHRKRTRCESHGQLANVKVGEMDIKVKRDCISPGGRIDMLPDEESDLNRVESSVVELRRGTIKRREEAIRVDTSVDVTREDDETLEFKKERNSDAEGGSARERGEEAPVAVEEKEENREHFSCHDCGKDFQEKDVLIRHLELHGYVVNEESCIEEIDSQVDANINCRTKLKRSDSLKTGSKRKTSNKVKRDKGVRKYVRHSTLKKGTKRKRSDKVKRGKRMATYVCDLCGKGFNKIDHLKAHLRVHNGGKAFPCPICGKGFSYKFNLKSHKLIHTGKKPHTCEVCGMRFAQKYKLKDHGRTHSGEKPYECDTCGKKFSHSCTLTSHKRVHSGEKPFECETCGKKYSHSGSLTCHRRVHSGEKPYLCEICGIHFANRNNLKTHKRVHTGEKPYKCDICGKTFSQNGTLKQHKRLHSGEKPFSCKICSKSFRDRSNLSKHLRVHSQ